MTVRPVHLLIWIFGPALCALAAPGAGAKEVDSFTGRYEALALPAGEHEGRPVTDFTAELNSLVNRLVGDVLIRLNDENRRKDRTCLDPRSRKRLFRKLRNALGGPIIFTDNRLRPAILSHPNRFKTKLAGSVYRDFPTFSTISLTLLSKFNDMMAETFRFDLDEGPILVSSDKFSHFFFRGLILFRKLQESGLDAALAYNLRTENTWWGAIASGITAYGDLVANFQGMRFWIHVLGEDFDGSPLADPLGGGPAGPYVSCSEEGRWARAEEIDMRTYLDPAWDEGLNCSRFRSEKLLGMVVDRLEELERTDPLGRSYGCPMDRELIRETAAGYAEMGPLLINAESHRTKR